MPTRSPDDSRWATGLGAWDELFRCDESFFQKVNAWMAPQTGLDTGYRLLRDPRGLRLEDVNTGVSVTPRDVGVGVSQLVPVLVLASSPGIRFAAIEQPELHLHPAMQVRLGDLFIAEAIAGKKTLVIESHSEHLLLRIMRRMRETATDSLPEGSPPVRPEDVAILYVERSPTGTTVRELPLNERGQLVKAWPGGFFEEGLNEVL